MKIGFIQYAPETGKKNENLETIKNLLNQAQGDLFVLPEMGLTGYPVASKEELLQNAEGENDFLVQELIKLAKAKDTCLIVSIPELVGGKVYNTAMVLGPSGLITKHQKSHLFMEEKKYFEPGTTQPCIFEWRGAKVGLGVCYDYMFPEFWRRLALNGVHLFCNTANFVSEYGFPMMRARSIENGVFSITTNRIGDEWEIKYKGGSEIVDNRGNVLEKGDVATQSIRVVDVDLSLAEDKNWNLFNNLFGDRRADLY